MKRIDYPRGLVTANIVKFRELLTCATDDFERQQIEGLLARELDKLELLAQPAPLGRPRTRLGGVIAK